MADYKIKAAEVRDRANQLLKERGITENSAAAGDSAAQKRLNSQLSHGASISLDSLLRILDACPDVSADWLIRGGDEAYSNASGAITGANKATGDSVTVIGQQSAALSETFVRDLLAEKDRQIQTLLTLLGK